jgi:hypothetical protein
VAQSIGNKNDLGELGWPNSIIFTLDPKNPKYMAQKANLSTLPDYVAHMQLYPLINALRKKKRIIIIAGAGISASAGSKQLFSIFLFTY